MQKKRIEKLNQAEAIAHQTRKQLEEFGDKIPADKKAPIEAAVKKLEDAHKAGDVAAVDAAIKEIETTFGAVQQDILNAQAQQQAQQGPNPGASNPGNGDDHVSDVEFEDVK